VSAARDPEIETRFFEHARDILLVLDAETGRIIDANQAAVDAYGYTHDELVELTIFQLRADPTNVPAQMAAAGARGVLFETAHRRKDGSVFDVEVNSRGHVTGGRKLLLSVIRDITERRRLELERIALIETSARTLAVREEFLIVAPHELRAPITNVSLQMQHLVRMIERGQHDALAAPARAALDEVLRLSSLITTMIEAQYDSSGHIMLARTSFDIAELVQTVAERLRPRADVFGSAIGIDIPTLHGMWDRLRLAQVFTNLLSNAIKYGGGRSVEILGSGNESSVEIKVRDHGIGIERGDADRIFEKFERAVPANYGGLGLGLYTSRQLVEAHGGTIRVESTLGEGSTFTVVLPR
jgi:two-component system, LuxR family, sensor kinase FixL